LILCKYLTVNDPAIGQYDWIVVPVGGTQDADLDGILDDADFNSPPGGVIDTIFFMPRGARGRSDEPEVSKDTDGDGLMDFDEQRFGTNPAVKDTDSDDIDDKPEIRAWVFDEKYGYWPQLDVDNSNRDGDKKRMEVDEDSDNGGCTDGLEDQNTNGKHEANLKEFYNFEKADDPCITGTYEDMNEETWEVKSESIHNKNYLFRHYRLAISLKPAKENQLEGLAVVQFNSRESRTSLAPSPCEASSITDPIRFSMRLTGDARTLPDGSIELTIRAEAPARPPTARLRWQDSCATPPSGSSESPSLLGAALPIPQVRLVNGVYDQYSERPAREGDRTRTPGKSYTKTHLEQKKPGQR
jgi:hypothetical protein